MFDIHAFSADGGKTTKSVMSRELLSFWVKAFLKCEDFERLVICDGLTGEVLLEL